MTKYNVVMCSDKINSAPHTRTPNQKLHMRPHLPRFYHNNTSLHCILSFNDPWL